MIAVLKIPMNAWKVSAKSHARPMDIMEEKKTIATMTTRKTTVAHFFSVMNFKLVSLME